jgi:hypothetical protein
MDFKMLRLQSGFENVWIHLIIREIVDVGLAIWVSLVIPKTMRPKHFGT